MLTFFGVFNAQLVTLHPPRIRRGQEESEGSFIGGGSQSPTRRLNAYPLIHYLLF